MNCGSRIALLRKKRRLTQEEVAQSIGVSRAAYSHYEHNRRKPNYTTLSRISSLFHVSIDYLLGRTEDPAETKQVPSLSAYEHITANPQPAKIDVPHNNNDVSHNNNIIPFQDQRRAAPKRPVMESNESRTTSRRHAVAIPAVSGDYRTQPSSSPKHAPERMSCVELSDTKLLKQFQLTIDGQAVTEEEAWRFIAFIRAERQG